MAKTITLTLDEELYTALVERIGEGNLDRFVDDTLRDHLASLNDRPSDEELDASYREKAADEESEREARE